MKRDDAFAEYVRRTDLTQDEIYTIEILIDRVRSDFEEVPWEIEKAEDEAREAPNYVPRFNNQHIKLAVPLLLEKTSISLQVGKNRPIRDLTALKYLTQLTWLAINDNEVQDISPLSYCVELKEIHLQNNQITDLSPLQTCTKIEQLNFGGNQLNDLSVLEKLPNLKEVHISEDTLNLFRSLSNIEPLQNLEFTSADSFEGLPAMPNLKLIRSAKMKSLAGLERYPSIVNLVNLSGDFDSFEPLGKLPNLTHINTWNQVTCLKPLEKLIKLRELFISTSYAKIDLEPLYSIPALHSARVTIKETVDDSFDHPDLKKLQKTLPSWDVEFRVEKRYNPTLKVEVVDQRSFDQYDTEEKYGITKLDDNHELLGSELDWLDKNFEKSFLKLGLEDEEDFYIPFQWHGGRSRTIMVQNNQTAKQFRTIVSAIQNTISECHRDWIIYFQTDLDVSKKNDFIVWVYPDKIVTTKEYEKNVKRLIKKRSLFG